MSSKKLIQITFVILSIGILFSVNASILIFINKSAPEILVTTKLLFSALVSGFAYGIFYLYFQFIQFEQAKKSSLVVGACLVLMAILKAFDLYGNKVVAIIIGMFFAFSYIFWVVIILKKKHNSKAYKHIKNFIISTIILMILMAVYPVYLGAYILHNPSTEKETINYYPAISGLLYQIPWVFYFLFLKELPNEKPKNHQKEVNQEEPLLDAEL